MEVKELAIGDWVNVFDTPKQIEGIRKFKTGDEIVYYDGDNENFVENVTPIPLTKEILLKNGFEDFAGGGCIIKEPEDDEEPIYIWNGNDSIYVVDYCSLNKYTYIKECKYVHEFQHELKSCGIKKEIVL